MHMQHHPKCVCGGGGVWHGCIAIYTFPSYKINSIILHTYLAGESDSKDGKSENISGWSGYDGKLYRLFKELPPMLW